MPDVIKHTEVLDCFTDIHHAGRFILSNIWPCATFGYKICNKNVFCSLSKRAICVVLDKSRITRRARVLADFLTTRSVRSPPRVPSSLSSFSSEDTALH